jgi:hypothetical protein
MSHYSQWWLWGGAAAAGVSGGMEGGQGVDAGVVVHGACSRMGARARAQVAR